MTETAQHDCKTLVAHAGWVRALARRLSPDLHGADDLAQEALAAVLVRPPPADRPLRGWLGAILRNLARRERRDTGRRRAHEREIARVEIDRSESGLLERLEDHRVVVQAVARLPEPYRTTVVLRYFEDLTPAEISARTKAPLRTVHTRLNRGLVRLRGDLAREHERDRRSAWLAWIPRVFGAGPSAGSAAAIGACLMDAKLKFGLAALLLVGVCSTVVLFQGETPDVEPVSPAAGGNRESAEHAAARDDGLRREPAAALAGRIAEGSQSIVDTPAATAADAASRRLAGRVIDVERAPVAGVSVVWVDPIRSSQPSSTAVSGSDGAFEFLSSGRWGHLDIAAPGWTSVLRPELASASEGQELVLVVARSVRLAGVVADEAGRPLEGAVVAVPLPVGLRSRLGAILDASKSIERSTRTDPTGRFELAGAPLVAGADLVTTHESHVDDARALPERDELALEIVLRSARDEPRRLVGSVLDSGGAAVEGAYVALGDASTRSGPSGAFVLDLGAARDADAGATRSPPLRAVQRGFLPGEVQRGADGRWPEPLLVRLGAAALVLEGRVVDSRGEPIASADVWADEETHFGYIEIEGGEMKMRAGASIEGILRGDPWTRRTRTDARGRFVLAGLLAQDYRLRALDTRTLRVAMLDVAAGTRNVQLEMADEGLHERVAGRVTSLSGEPVAGVRVVLERRSEGA